MTRQIDLFCTVQLTEAETSTVAPNGGYARAPGQHSQSVLGMLIEPCRYFATQSGRRIVI